MSNWEYGEFYKKYPIEKGTAVFTDGSKLKAHDIFNPLPSYMLEADLMFIDPPWNQTNISSFYTKADKEFSFNFDTFCIRLFECIKQINPKTCYLEIGKEYLDLFIYKMKQQFKYVTFYNSTYYHKKDNKCYVVRGSNKTKKLQLDYMDEENIIEWICQNEDYDCIADLCMGRGLVAVNAYRASKRFVGTELNHKRLSVTLSRLVELGAEYKVEMSTESKLAKLRKSKHLTQQQIADLIGVTLRQYQRYEKSSDIGTMSFRNGILLSQVLGVVPEELID